MAVCLMSLDDLTHLLLLLAQLYRRSALQARQEQKKYLIHIIKEIRRQIHKLSVVSLQIICREKHFKKKEKEAFLGQVSMPYIHDTSF